MNRLKRINLDKKAVNYIAMTATILTLTTLTVNSYSEKIELEKKNNVLSEQTDALKNDKERLVSEKDSIEKSAKIAESEKNALQKEKDTLLAENDVIKSELSKKTEEVKQLEKDKRELATRSSTPRNTATNTPTKSSSPSPSGKSLGTFNASAYGAGAEENGGYAGITAMGTKLRPGVVAVDPNVIPLGTKLTVKFANGSTMDAIAEDTGGAIKGKKIDIFMHSGQRQFGRQSVELFIR